MEDIRTKVGRALSAAAGTLAIGVSGGRDSMCLLDAACSCGISKDRILCVHVNHALRAEADSDEAFVREYCKARGIRFAAYRVDVREMRERRGMTVEQAARELRYGVFYELIKTRAADVIVTAHHALDNAETVLMHLFRGSGVDGLCGMTGENVVRPLLDVYPDELDAYAAEHGIAYVVDKTNLETDADRNYIRLKVLPAIEERYPGAVRAINALSGECTAMRAFLDGALDRSQLRTDRGAVIISDSALSGPLAERYVREALKAFTLTDMTRADICAVAALCKGRMGGRRALPHGIEAAREAGGVALYVPRERCDREVAVCRGTVYLDGLAIEFCETACDPHGIKGGAVDMQKLEGAVVRFRRDGDVFRPFGGGEKKLKQYFIDNKVPKRLRDRIPLVARGSEILVVVGMQISEKVKQTERTKEKYTVRQKGICQ